MENFKIVYILLVMSASAAVSGEEGITCCSHGYVKMWNHQYHCWTPTTNLTTPLDLKCPPAHREGILIASKQLKFSVNEFGQLVIMHKNRDVIYEPGKFCMGEKLSKSLEKQRIAVVFNEKIESFIDENVYGYCMIISSIFLFITAVIYATRNNLRDLQGKSIINLCGSLGIGLGILAAMKLISYIDMNLCAARGFLAYFFVVASFFWTNVLSIQILLKMRRPMNSSVEGETGFIWYMLYAWGCPTILTVAMAIVNFVPGDHAKPGIGLDHCWFFDSKQQWQYMYSVMSILIAVNIVIFIYATTLLWHHWYSSDKCKYKFLMTARLFIVMGLPWVFEMIDSLTPHHWSWEVLDLLNSLQGVFIFIVLVLFPTQTAKSEDNAKSGSHYNFNITIEQPYNKM